MMRFQKTFVVVAALLAVCHAEPGKDGKKKKTKEEAPKAGVNTAYTAPTDIKYLVEPRAVKDVDADLAINAKAAKKYGKAPSDASENAIYDLRKKMTNLNKKSLTEEKESALKYAKTTNASEKKKWEANYRESWSDALHDEYKATIKYIDAAVGKQKDLEENLKAAVTKSRGEAFGKLATYFDALKQGNETARTECEAAWEAYISAAKAAGVNIGADIPDKGMSGWLVFFILLLVFGFLGGLGYFVWMRFKAEINKEEPQGAEHVGVHNV